MEELKWKASFLCLHCILDGGYMNCEFYSRKRPYILFYILVKRN
jgi:hypothetical protein